MTKGGAPDITDTDSDDKSVDQIYDIGVTTRCMISSVKVDIIPSRNVSKIEATAQDVPQAKTLQSKGLHSTVSPEELSEWWKIALKQAS